MSRTRPAHYALFTLEPLFLLAALTTGPDVPVPEPWIVEWLRRLVEHARGIPLGEIEVIRERGGRYAVRLKWFEKMLARWEGSEYGEVLDGSLWELGWRDFGTLSWGLI